jgi:hypothetical protein
MPHFIQTEQNFLMNMAAINRTLTTGMSAILDVLRYNPKEIYVTGFDFFKSKIHHGRLWKDGDGGHDNEGEKKLLKKLMKENSCIKTDKTIKGLL